MVTRFLAYLRTDNSPQPKEAQPMSHAHDIRLIQHFDSSAHGLVRSYLFIGTLYTTPFRDPIQTPAQIYPLRFRTSLRPATHGRDFGRHPLMFSLRHGERRVHSASTDSPVLRAAGAARGGAEPQRGARAPARAALLPADRVERQATPATLCRRRTRRREERGRRRLHGGDRGG
jgi:hypothetical protein